MSKELPPAIYIRDCLKRANEIKFDKDFTKWSIANADVVL